MRELRWLHMSDVHFPPADQDKYDLDKRLTSLLKYLRTECLEKGHFPHLIVFSGDIAEYGIDYSRATPFFNALLRDSGLIAQYGPDAKRHLFIVPGNHDVERERSGDLEKDPRKPVVSTYEDATKFFSSGPNPTRETMWLKFSQYANFFNSFYAGVRNVTADNHSYVDVLDLQDIDLRVGVIALNSAWFCRSNNWDLGKLWIGESVCYRGLEKLHKYNPTITLAVFHHPLTCLNHLDYKGVKPQLSMDTHICLYGHIESPETQEIKDEYGELLRLQAPALFTKPGDDSGLHYCTATIDDGQVTILPLKFYEPDTWKINPGTFPKSDDGLGRFRFPVAVSDTVPPAGNVSLSLNERDMLLRTRKQSELTIPLSCRAAKRIAKKRGIRLVKESVTLLSEYLSILGTLLNKGLLVRRDKKRWTTFVLTDQGRELSEKYISAAQDQPLFRDGVYWFYEANAEDGPFCPTCWDSKNERVRLHGQPAEGKLRMWWGEIPVFACAKCAFRANHFIDVTDELRLQIRLR